MTRKSTKAPKEAPASSQPATPSGLTFALAAARLAAATRCHQVTLLDVRGLSPVTDYFVIATGTSPRQMRTVCEQVKDLGDEQNFKALSTSGLDGETWMLVDFVDVMVHVLAEEARGFYDLDGLWGDAKTIEWRPDETKG